MRRVILILVTVLFIAVGFSVYVWTQPKRPMTSLNPIASTNPSPLKPNEGNMVVGGGDRPWVTNYDKDGKPDSQFRAEEYTPRKDGNVYVTKPQATFFMQGGKQELRLIARDGLVAVDESPESNKENTGFTGPAQAPRRGQLFGVRMMLVSKDAPDQPILSLQEINNITFDSDTLRIYTVGYGSGADAVKGDQVPVKIDGIDYAFEGTGLMIRWSDSDKRLELLEVAHGKQLVIKNPSQISNPVSSKKRLSVVPMPMPSARVVESKTSVEENSHVSVPLPAMLASTDDTIPSLPNTSLPPAIYRAAFLDNVRVVQADQTLVTADVMNVEFLLRDQQATATTKPTPPPSTAPTTNEDVDGPSANPTAQSPKSQLPATQEASQPPIIVYWTGPMRVTPQKESVVPLGPGDSAVQVVGSPVKMTREGSTVECASFIYQTRTQEFAMLGSPTFPVITMHSAEGANLTTSRMDYSAADRRVILHGKSNAKIPTGGKDAANSETLDASWTDTSEIFLTAAAKGESTSLDRLKLHGDVVVVHPRLKMNADSLELGFKSNPQKQTSLSHLAASGNVKMTDSEQELSCGNLDVTMAPATEKSLETKEISATAIQDLLAERDVNVKMRDGSIAKADRLTIAMKDGQPQIELRGNASVVDKNQTTLNSELIQISAEDQKAAIPSAGKMHATRPGEGKQAGRPVDISWTGSAIADGAANRIEITGGVQATSTESDGAISSATGEKLIVTLADVESPATTKPASGTSPQSPLKNKQVVSVSLQQKADMKSVLSAADGSLIRRVNLLADRIDYDMLAKRVTVPVPGRMLVEDHGKKEAAAKPDQMSPDQNGATAFEWKKDLVYDESAKRAVMNGDVVIVHQSDDKKDPPMRLKAQQVAAQFAAADANSPQGRVDLKEISANGGLEFAAKGIQFEADSLVYEPAKHLVTSNGTARTPINLFNENGISTGSVDEVIYNIQTGQAEMKNFRASIRK